MTLMTEPPTPGRRGPDPLTKIAIICVVVVGLLWLFMRLAHADATPAPAPVPVAIDWQIWIALGIAALAGVRAIVDTLLAFFKVEAPLTKTTIDDSIRDSLAVVHLKLDKVAGTVNGLVDASKPAGGVPVLSVARNPEAGSAQLRVIVAIAVIGAALAGMAMIGCTAAQRTAAPHAVVDCTAANAAAIGAAAAAMRAEKPAGCAIAGDTDWPCVERKAVAAGLAIGGCAFLEVVAADKAPAAAAPVESRPGRAAFESYRASVAGGAAFRTAGGDL